MAKLWYILEPKGSRVLLLGNEAIARGALEAGIGFAAAYPGTPSTEIMETLADVARDVGIHVEWSTNEKVAFESAYAAALSGVKALTAMKHVGLNVAADILMSSAYSGVNAGFVVVSADDPYQHSSQNEQDNRWYGFISHIPVVEPWSPASAYRLVKAAFQLSEKYMHPVILRSTTRISHTRQPVLYEDDIPSNPKTKGVFKRDISRYVLVPMFGRKLKKKLMEKWSRVMEEEGREPFIEVINPGCREVVIASGISYAHVMEAIGYTGREYTVLRVSLPVPLPYKPVLEVARDAKKILVVEELDPIVEMQVKKILYENGLDVEVHGKDVVPINYELNLEIVYKAIAEFSGLETTSPWKPLDEVKTEPPIPSRPPILCPGCPHRATFYVLKTAARKAGLKNPLYTGDIGCYTLGMLKPFETQQTSFEMGGSIGVAHGFSKVIDDPVIAVIGDSTFYHAGIPASINIVYNKGHAVITVLDNYYTSMTGHQPDPGTGVTATGELTKRIPAEDILKSLGYSVYVINPIRVNESIEELVKAFEEYKSGRSVAVVSRLKCALQVVREARRRGVKHPVYTVDKEKCRACMVCVNQLACPSIVIDSDGKPRILKELCIGCSLCAQVCPFNAIVLEKPGDPEWEKLWG